MEPISTTNELSDVRRTHPFVDDLGVVGRDGDMSRVIDMLVNSNNQKDLSVISIVGMAGQGKTTLAELVYKNDKVMIHLEQRI